MGLTLDPRVAAFDRAVDDEISGGGASPVPLINSENEGAVHGLVAARLAAEDAARMKELNRLTGTGPKEIEMPKGIPNVPRKPKSCCGSMGTRHLGNCTGGVAPTPERLANIVKAAAKVKRETSAEKSGLTDMEVGELVQLVADCREELARRRDATARDLALIDEALGAAA